MPRKKFTRSNKIERLLARLARVLLLWALGGHCGCLRFAGGTQWHLYLSEVQLSVEAWVPRLPPKLLCPECLLQPAGVTAFLDSMQQAVARQGEQQRLHAQHESNIPTHDRDAYTRALPAALPSLCPALAAQLPCPCTCRAACCCLSCACVRTLIEDSPWQE